MSIPHVGMTLFFSSYVNLCKGCHVYQDRSKSNPYEAHFVSCVAVGIVKQHYISETNYFYLHRNYSVSRLFCYDIISSSSLIVSTSYGAAVFPCRPTLCVRVVRKQKLKWNCSTSHTLDQKCPVSR